jgi:hypothetical protein
VPDALAILIQRADDAMPVYGLFKQHGRGCPFAPGLFDTRIALYAAGQVSRINVWAERNGCSLLCRLEIAWRGV